LEEIDADGLIAERCEYLRIGSSARLVGVGILAAGVESVQARKVSEPAARVPLIVAFLAWPIGCDFLLAGQLPAEYVTF
jgi:hypothetical protein